MFSPRRNVLVTNQLYAFGNTFPRDILEAFYMDGCEGELIKLLFLGCGDLRNALFTLAQRSTTNTNTFQIHVNDIDTVIVARNVLILKVITASNFKEEDVEYVVDLWYNFNWYAGHTRQRFLADVKELLHSDLPEQIVVSDAHQLDQLKTLWARWLSLANSTGYTDPIFIQSLSKKRFTTLVKTMPPGKRTKEEALILHIEFPIKLCLSKDSPVIPKLKKETGNFIETGNMSARGKTVHCINPTLLRPFTDDCCVDITCFPYYLIRPSKAEEENNIEPAIRFKATLTWMISSYREKKEKVKFYFDNSDALEYCFKVPTTFDVVDSSNLPDHIGLANVIIAAQKILAEKETSILFTQGMTWRTLNPILLNYIETALGVPVTMIPTIYGLQLTNRFELGAPKITLLPGSVGNAIDFMWRKAPRMDVPFDITSPEFQKCLKELQQRCFVLMNQTTWKNETQTVGVKPYTPMTLNFLLTSLEKRLRLTSVRRFEVHPVFQATYRALSDWSKGYPVSVMKWTFPYSDDTFYWSYEHTFVRLVLMPPPAMTTAYNSVKDELMKFVQNPTSEESGFLFIDNFSLNMIKKKGKVDKVEISFLLPIDHRLHQSYGIMLLYVAREEPIYVSSSISECTVEEMFTPSHPYLKKKRTAASPITEIVADSCLETKSGFTINCHFGCETGGALKVETDNCPPSESSQRIMLSFATKAKDTLKITLPYPILSSSIKTSISREQKSIKVMLVKAVREPWPVEFSAVQQKWDVSDLLQCPNDTFEDIEGQMGAQFSLDECRILTFGPIPGGFDPANPLRKIRLVLSSIFRAFLDQNKDLFEIKLSQDRIWMIQAYKPLLKSDKGVPILPVTACDFQLLKKLPNHKGCAEFRQIFGNEPKISSTFTLNNQEEADIFRFVMRLNSTRISWKDNQLAPTSNNMTILTTYLSPLYEEFTSKDCWDELILPGIIKLSRNAGVGVPVHVSPKPVSQKPPCVKCGTLNESMRRCSRCKKIYYCSSECQRADWKQHKKICEVA